MWNDPAEKNHYLEWRGNEAWRDGRKRFEIVKEKTGWKLYRFTERRGDVVFKSKESVRSLVGGKCYAEQLARLANFTPL